MRCEPPACSAGSRDTASCSRAIDNAALSGPARNISDVQMQFPELPYVAVGESFNLPPGANFGGTSGIAFDSRGHIFVLHRGQMPIMEFDPDGNFIRGFGDG